MEKLIKQLRELQTLTEHCGEQSCYECKNRELCDKHDNKTLSRTYKEAADTIEKLSAIISKMEKATLWIPVTERLPEEGVSVQVCFHSQGGIAQAVSERFVNDRNQSYWSGLCGMKPTHWMPLPQKPKGE